MLHKTLLVCLVFWARVFCEQTHKFDYGRWDVNVTYHKAVEHLGAHHPLKLETVKAGDFDEELDRYSHYSLILETMRGHKWQRCTVDVAWPFGGHISVESDTCVDIER